jgi:ribonuclease HII
MSTVVCGIDEAGYGPHLGPLVVAAAAFRLADGAREAALHRLVALKDGGGGLPIDDSKKMWNGRRCMSALETTVLGHVVLGRGLLPLRVGTLLDGAIDFAAEEVEELPWYAGRLLALRLPRRAAVAELLERTERHAELLADRGLSCAAVLVAPVPEPRFNQSTRHHGTKAWPLFFAAARLVEALMQRFPRDEVIIHVDRQGGRIHYGEMLQGFFPMAPLRVLRERPLESIYLFDFPARPPVTVHVHVEADASKAPVALASLAAKCVRELFMESLNGWFAERIPGVRPTAGYHADAHRFLRDVAAVPEHEAPRERLVRIR